ncbi:MAG: NAD(P)/FAD-dependent oxidoreductase [Bacillales bacterium]|nr:NAD(P)/FAD-dependent oxidoreductase [Bacillales bacterium]
MKYNVAIIGAGITGTAIAFELSKYDINVCLIEANNDVAMATTKANSGIVHAGYDPLPGTNMARLNVLGNKMYEELAPKLNVHYKKIGSLVIGRNEENRKLIETLYERGIKNGVPGMKILSKEEVRELEPNIQDDVDCALYAPSAGIVSPWEMALALAENAVRNGVDIKLSTKVVEINKVDGVFQIITNKKMIEADYVINAAGLYADEVYKMVLNDNDLKAKSFKIVPVKGEYYLLDKTQGKLANHVVFQTPNELGKGVLVSPTVHGNLIVGPNASYSARSKNDVSNTSEAFDYVRVASSISIKDISFRDNIRNFAGVRATIPGLDDFIIEESPYVKGFINFGGIKSPGLTAAPAFGLEAVELLRKCGASLNKKVDWDILPLPKFYKDMTKEEINQKIKENPQYGQIICRCETVSEGEIVDALHRPFVVNSIDGIKRRTNAGMGRCQGGFCGPKVLEIIKRELHIKADEVLQDKEGSNIVLSYTKGGKDDE